MRVIKKMYVIESVDELNEMIGQPLKFRLREIVVDGSRVTFYVGELIELEPLLSAAETAARESDQSSP